MREWWGPPGSGHYGPGDDNLFGPFQNCLRNSGCRCNHPTRYDAEPVPCIEDFLNGQEPLNINCRPGWGPRTGNLRVHRNCDRDGSKTTCAWTDFRANPPWINICPDGFSRCDLACVIAHELIHACGASHIGGSQGCFDCIPKLPGCSKYTYGSSKELVDPR